MKHCFRGRLVIYSWISAIGGGFYNLTLAKSEGSVYRNSSSFSSDLLYCLLDLARFLSDSPTFYYDLPCC